MKKILFLFLLFITKISFSQSLSDYKYVLVPKTFSFQKKAHQYNLNKLTQFLLNKYNFEALIEDDDGQALSTINPCELLKLKTIAKGTMITKITFNFIDCKGNIVYTTKEGVSRKKEYKESYTEAIRNVFNDRVIKIHSYSKKNTKSVLVEKNQIQTQKAPTIKSSEAFQLDFELRGVHYNFVPLSKTKYSIIKGGQSIGTASKMENSELYNVDAGLLSGKGVFDSFGNFKLKRINPANKKELIDTLIRTK